MRFKLHTWVDDDTKFGDPEIEGRSLLRVWTARWSTGRWGGLGVTVGRRVLFVEQSTP